MLSAPAATTTDAGAHRRAGRPRFVDVLDARRLGAVRDPRQHALDRRVRAQLEDPRASACAMYVFIVDLPAFVGQPWMHEPQLVQFASVYECDRLEPGAERTETGLHGVDALRPVGPLADPEHALDAVVVRVEVGDDERLAPARSSARWPRCHFATSRSCARNANLRVDRRRSANAAAGEESHQLAVRERRAAGAARRGRASPSPPSA